MHDVEFDLRQPGQHESMSWILARIDDRARARYVQDRPVQASQQITVGKQLRLAVWHLGQRHVGHTPLCVDGGLQALGHRLVYLRRLHAESHL
jgi:hypothetical protein